MLKKKYFLISALILFLFLPGFLSAQEIDLNQKKKEVLEKARVKAAEKEIEITVRSVDIGQFPKIKVFIEAFNKRGEPLDTLTADNLYIFENGISKKVLAVDKIPVSETVMVDFVFVIDQTGSMQKYINAVYKNISKFSRSLMQRGIDFRLGLVLFSDELERMHQPTKNVGDFLGWLSGVKARGGGDEKENALEALELAAKMDYRPDANKVAVLITDAPFHKEGENGHGVTNQTKESIIKEMVNAEVRVFTIVPPRLEDYADIAGKTRGTFYDIDYPFSTILDNFSNQLTNLYSLVYRSDQESVPDSIEIAVFDEKIDKLIKKTIPIVELGRKLIIENLLYQTNKYDIPDSIPELDVLAEFLNSKPNIVIMIEGHTDNIGSNSLNDRLSEKRALSVKKYLMKRGIQERRVKIKGYGERRPIASNNTEFGRRLNRRTEIVIVAK